MKRTFLILSSALILMLFAGCTAFIQTHPMIDDEFKLWQASTVNDLDRVKDLLAKGVNPDYSENKPFSEVINDRPLLFAVRHNNTEMAKALLEAGADVNWVNSSGITALTVSVRHSNIALTELLIDAGANDRISKYFWSEVLYIKPSNSYLRFIVGKLSTTNSKGTFMVSEKKNWWDISIKLFNGKGIYLDSVGNRYDGNVKDNIPNGFGSWELVSGHIIEGNFKNNELMNGKMVYKGKETLFTNGVTKPKADKTKQNSKERSASREVFWKGFWEGFGNVFVGLAVFTGEVLMATFEELPEAYIEAEMLQQKVNRANQEGYNRGRASCRGMAHC